MYPPDTIVHTKHGVIHCEDGPAVIFKNGRRRWLIDGRQIWEDYDSGGGVPAGIRRLVLSKHFSKRVLIPHYPEDFDVVEIARYQLENRKSA